MNLLFKNRLEYDIVVIETKGLNLEVSVPSL